MTFLCTDKEKSPKEIRPGAADLSRCASGSAGKSRAHFPVRPFALPPAALTLRFSPKSALAPTRRALNNAPRAQTRGPLFPILAAMLGGYGFLKTPFGQAERRVQPKRGPAGASEGSRACASATGCRVCAPTEANAARGNRRSRRRPGGVLSLVSFFARTKKETRPRCGEPQLTRGRRPLDICARY